MKEIELSAPKKVNISDVPYGTVTGRIVYAHPDNTDSGAVPDTYTISDLRIRFEPTVSMVRAGGNVYIPVPFEVGVDDQGYILGHDDDRSLTVLATMGDGIEPAGWGYTVTTSYPGWVPFTISVPKGGTVDLASVVPIDRQSGVVKVVATETIAGVKTALARATELMAQIGNLESQVRASTAKVDESLQAVKAEHVKIQEVTQAGIEQVNGAVAPAVAKAKQAVSTLGESELAKLREPAQQAQASADGASASKTSAANSAQQAQASAQQAQASADGASASARKVETIAENVSWSGDVLTVAGKASGHLRGPQGEQGAIGPAGARGERGAPGPAGPRGETGQAGPRGERGEPGPQGVPGPRGERGEPGPAGADGTMTFEELTGPQRESLKGDRGEPGPQGAPGPAGPRGERGEQGAPGPAGADGARGAQGPAGQDGARGPAGPTGPRGERGPAGTNGATGATGPRGATGTTGARGPKGDPGENVINQRTHTPTKIWIGSKSQYDSIYSKESSTLYLIEK